MHSCIILSLQWALHPSCIELVLPGGLSIRIFMKIVSKFIHRAVFSHRNEIPQLVFWRMFLKIELLHHLTFKHKCRYTLGTIV